MPTCNASGNPRPIINWYNGGSILKGNTTNIYMSPDNKSLTIINTQRSDASNYTCQALNIVGNESSSVILFVYCEY